MAWNNEERNTGNGITLKLSKTAERSENLTWFLKSITQVADTFEVKK